MELEQKAEQGTLAFFRSNHIWAEVFHAVFDIEYIQAIFRITPQQVLYLIYRKVVTVFTD
jgi:hypothetical protein